MAGSKESKKSLISNDWMDGWWKKEKKRDQAINSLPFFSWIGYSIFYLENWRKLAKIKVNFDSDFGSYCVETHTHTEPEFD